jgi:hypothetical protein
MAKQQTVEKTKEKETVTETEIAPKPIVVEDVKLDNPLTDKNIFKEEPPKITKETIMQVVCTKTEVTEMLESQNNQKSIELVLEDYKTSEKPSESDKLIIQYLECVLKEMTRDIKVVDAEIVK